MKTFHLVAMTPPKLLDPAIAIAAARAGELGVLDLTMTGDAARARGAVARLARFAPSNAGLRVDAARARLIETLLTEGLPRAVETVVVVPGSPKETSAVVAAVSDAGREAWVEVASLADARDAVAAGADALVARGHESGGWVAEETTFILLQRLAETVDLPIYAQGGIGRHTVAACAVAGAAGAFVGAQLWLTRESTLPAAVRGAIRSMDGSETAVVGTEIGAGFRLYARPHLSAAADLAQRSLALAAGKGGDADRAGWRRDVEDRVAWTSDPDAAWPLGQDAAFAADLADRYHTVSGVLGALRDAVTSHAAKARELRPLDEGSPLAESHGTRYPVVQGPMTRVSDTAPFAKAVADGGALPFLALALMRGKEVEALLEETSRALEGRSWGVGILGFVPLELRQEQLEVIHRYRPPYALIAGGRPDQAKKLEDVGIRTYLHVPSPGLLKLFVQDGARRFVFEGRECGGHVGPRSSFVLWNTMIDVLLRDLPADDAKNTHVLFAGGIHDERSAAMVAAMAAPIAERGVRVGVLLGTSYLFTEEAVSGGAIGESFQQQALACSETVLVESGPGHAVRCVPNPFTAEFEEAKQRLHAEGKSAEEIRHELEALNIGRLRVASKGLTRNPRWGEEGQPKLVDVSPDEQQRVGMYMIGQLAAMHGEKTTVAALHASVSTGATERLDSGRAAGEAIVEIEPAETSRPSRVAIIGMSCLLPKANDVGTLWDNIRDKVYAIEEIPEHHWDWRDYFDEDRTARDRIYSRWGGFIGKIAFDPMEFGMPPASLPSIDPMQLLALHATREALRDAGYLGRDFNRRETSVILGASGGTGDLGTYYNLRTGLPLLFGKETADRIVDETEGLLPDWTEDSFAGLLPNVAAGRIANRFDLGGLNFVCDSACASSLTAVHLAVKELETHGTDMVIAGGVDTVNTPFGYMCFSKTHALSPKGVPRTFDESADGIAISEGVALLVLKRLEDAERDGDRIYAVIQAVAGSSDGKAKGLTAPRPEGQQIALERAYRKAGFDPKTVELFEAHGTGTVVGDRTEAVSLTTFLEENGAEPASHAVGSIKSMIGHTKASAGVAGLAKVALSIYHQVLPPTLGVTTPNPKARLGDGPLYVNSEARPWIRGRGDHPRRAGVSAFGFGGTNFHAVVEEYTGDYLPRRPVSSRRPSELLVWSASSRSAIEEQVTKLEADLGGDAEPAMHDLAFTLAKRYEKAWAPGNVCLAIVASSRDDLLEKLGKARAALARGGTVDDPAGVVFTEEPLGRDGKVAVLFPGQGSQYPDMLRDLALHEESVRACFERADRELADRYPRPLSAYVFPPPSFTPAEKAARQKELTETNVAQPALGAADSAMWGLLRRAGLEAQMFAGHSYGEYAALHAAGVFDEATLARLSEVRGRSIIEAAKDDLGTMASVTADAAAVKKALGERDDVWIANLNAPKQTIISGTGEGLERAARDLEAAGLSVRPIPVACAFHSPLVAPAQERLAEALRAARFSEPHVTVFSNTTGGVYPTSPEAAAELLSEHLTSPVRFADEIEAMYAAGARLFVEAGPKSVLSGLARSILGDRPHVAIATDQPGRDGVTQLNAALARLAAHGVRLTPSALFEGRDARELKLEALVAETRPDPLPKMAWYVNGAKAWPHAKPLPAVQRSRLVPASQVEEVRRSAAAAGSHAAPGPARPAATPASRTAPPPAPAALHGGAPAGATPSTVPPVAAGSRDPGVDQVMLQYQEMMSRFLETQGQVMAAYLGAPASPSATPWQGPASEWGTPWQGPASEWGSPAAASAEGETPAPAPVFLEPESAAIATPPTTADPASATTTAEPDLATEEPELVTAKTEAKTAVPSREALTTSLLDIVSERTGYPPEMLDLDADVEAELGIDSIKRIEIISALQKTFMPEPDQQDPDAMEKLTAVKSLGGIVDWIVTSVENVRGAAAQAGEAGAASDDAAAPADDAPSRDELTSELLRVVSERTGYPPDMLDLNADVEAELGIDSIKRVEIIGAMRKAFFADEGEQDPIAMEELTAVKTLGGIVDWIVNTIEHATGRPAEEFDAARAGAGAAAVDAGAAGAPRAADTVAPPAAAGTTDEAARPTGAPAPLSRLVLEARPAPLNVVPAALPVDENRAVLITDDGNGAAIELASRIRDRGGRVAIVRSGDAVRELDTGCFEADLTEPSQVEALVERARERLGAVGALVHLLPLREPRAADDLGAVKARLADEVRSLFLLARAVGADLATHDGEHAAVIAAARLDGAWGQAAGKSAFFAGDGALAGLVKTLAIEWPGVRCRAIDVGAETDARVLVDRVASEWAHAGEDVQIGYADGMRHAFAPRAVPLDTGAPEAVPVDGDSVILLTGGARGITSEVALHLAGTFRPTLVLAGRSPLPEGEEDSETLAAETSQELKPILIRRMKEAGEEVSVSRVEAECRRILREREMRLSIGRMRALGADVHYAQVDARDEDAMRCLVAMIRREHGRLDGVIHGAGLIEDKLVVEKSPESFDRVFDTKADSAYVLSRVLDGDSLRFLVLFSSAAAAYGNRGQADYAAANELLNKLAVRLDAEWRARVVAIGWGPWATTGMVGPELMKQFEERGIALIGIEEGCLALENEIRFGPKGQPEVLVAGGAWGAGDRSSSEASAARPDGGTPGLPMLGGTTATRRGSTVDVIRTMDADADVLLHDHELDGKPVVPMALALEMMCEVAQQAYPDLVVSGARDVRVLRGIVVDRGPHPIRIAAKAQADPPHDRIGANVDVEITAVDGPLKHYRGTIELSDRLPEPPPFTPDTSGLGAFPLSVEDAYDQWLFHGPLFQGITSVDGVGERGIAASIAPSSPARCVAGQPDGDWLIDPVVIDSGLQMVILWTRHVFDMTPLPSRFERYRRYGSFAGRNLRCYIDARASMQGHSSLTTFHFVDEDGRVVGVLEDFEASSSRELNRLAAKRGA